jgi:Flp pilus assembly protein CpaB
MKKVADTKVPARILYFLTKSLGVIISIILLVVIVFLVMNKNNNQHETLRYAVARKSISAQQPITKDMIVFQEFEKGFTPINGITEEEASQLIGKKVFIPLQRGDIFNPGLFGATKGDLSGGIANMIPNGKKLVYIQADDVHVFPQDLQKDNRVDIIAVNQKETSNNTEVVAENITIFDVVHTQDNGLDSITKAGLLMSDIEIIKVSSKFTSDWKLSLSVHPQHEQETNSSSLNTQNASNEAVLKPTPSTNEKKEQ